MDERSPIADRAPFVDVATRKRTDSEFVFHELTRSICPSCKTVIDAKILLQGLHEQKVSGLRTVHSARL